MMYLCKKMVMEYTIYHAIMVFMQTEIHIDSAGRIVIPKEMRTQWGMSPDSSLVLENRPDGVLLRPQQKARMVEMDGMWVYDVPSAQDVDILALIESVRGERT